MKFFLNALLAIVILGGVLFGLNKFGIVTFTNLNSSTTMQGEGSGEIIGNLDDSNEVFDDTAQPKEVKEEDNVAAPTIIYANYPYNGEKSLAGEFTAYGNTQDGRGVLLYRVKLGGNLGGVINKWNTYSGSKSISGAVKFVDANGKEIARNEALAPNQVVYVEVQGFKVPDIMTEGTSTIAQPGTTTTSVNSNGDSKNTEINANPLSKSCVDYQEFFNCIISKVSGVDPDIMKNQLNAYFRAIKGLSESEQDAKCSNLIYEIKSKSTSGSQIACLDILK